VGPLVKKMGKTRGMRLYLYRKIGQSVVEYAVLLAIVATALIAMQVYLKRGLQGRIRDLANQVSPSQYEQGRSTSYYATNQYGKIVQAYNNGIAYIYQDGTNGSTAETMVRRGNETVMPETQ
jgi:Flp pilus assembly pilin Flp